MKNEQNNITDELLVKYLLNEATNTEAQQVELWINSSTDNKKHYSYLKQIWDKSSNLMAAASTANADEAWERFQKRTQNKNISVSLNKRYNWLKIAALLLLFVGAGTLLFLNRQNGASGIKTTNIAPPIVQKKTLDNKSENIENESVKKEIKKTAANEEKELATIKNPKKATRNNEYKKSIVSNSRKPISDEQTKTKGIICNGTPCPIEICITQTIKCHGQPSTVSTCSTLEPDESGRLHYKTHDKIGRHCTMSVDEITITTVSTGEKIVLNANSKPATAQDFFKYITGQKKGGILAGVFHDDCNNDQDCGLKFDNSFGGLILQ